MTGSSVERRFEGSIGCSYITLQTGCVRISVWLLYGCTVIACCCCLGCPDIVLGGGRDARGASGADQGPVLGCTGF